MLLCKCKIQVHIFQRKPDKIFEGALFCFAPCASYYTKQLIRFQ
nr:MAG TPA: hypothetical protein [Caudoviricetes sp.]